MVEKVLHGVNVAACCGQLATAAVDIASTGGAATLISAGLSSLALRRTPDAQAELKDLCLEAVHAHMAQAGLVEKVQKQIVLMLDSYLPGQKEFAAGDMQADKIAKGMRDRVAEPSQVPEYTDEAAGCLSSAANSRADGPAGPQNAERGESSGAVEAHE